MRSKRRLRPYATFEETVVWGCCPARVARVVPDSLPSSLPHSSPSEPMMGTCLQVEAGRELPLLPLPSMHPASRTPRTCLSAGLCTSSRGDGAGKELPWSAQKTWSASPCSSPMVMVLPPPAWWVCELAASCTDHGASIAAPLRRLREMAGPHACEPLAALQALAALRMLHEHTLLRLKLIYTRERLEHLPASRRRGAGACRQSVQRGMLPSALLGTAPRLLLPLQRWRAQPCWIQQKKSSGERCWRACRQESCRRQRWMSYNALPSCRLCFER